LLQQRSLPQPTQTLLVLKPVAVTLVAAEMAVVLLVRKVLLLVRMVLVPEKWSTSDPRSSARKVLACAFLRRQRLLTGPCLQIQLNVSANPVVAQGALSFAKRLRVYLHRCFPLPNQSRVTAAAAARFHRHCRVGFRSEATPVATVVAKWPQA
jgi:hypothetical protein